MAFIEEHDDCFSSKLQIGHATGSGWVVDSDRTHAILVHHATLNKWLQPGGHADGDPEILRVAIREVREETGLNVRAVSPEVFDLDSHEIPATDTVPAHVHHDICFLLEDGHRDSLIASAESRDIRWVALDKVALLTTDASILRMVAKTPPKEETGYENIGT